MLIIIYTLIITNYIYTLNFIYLIIALIKLNLPKKYIFIISL